MTNASSPTLPVAIEEALGEFNIPDYTQQVYTRTYYAIREQLGFRAKNNLGEKFTWDSFKAKFMEVFGTPEEPLFSLEQLLAFAQQKFGMDQEQLLEANKLSLERYRKYTFPKNKSQQKGYYPHTYNSYQEGEIDDYIPY